MKRGKKKKDKKKEQVVWSQVERSEDCEVIYKDICTHMLVCKTIMYMYYSGSIERRQRTSTPLVQRYPILNCVRWFAT